MTDSADLATRPRGPPPSKQAEDIAVLDVRELITITDYFVIVSGASERQVKTIADEVVRDVKEKGVRPVRREGESGAAGSCSTSSTSWSTCSTRRSGSSTGSRTCGATRRWWSGRRTRRSPPSRPVGQAWSGFGAFMSCR